MDFCIERMKRLKTNIELFQKHFRLLKNCDPMYVYSFNKEYCSEIKLVICKESFTHKELNEKALNEFIYWG